MKSRTFRVTISFDEDRESDIIKQLEGLADKRQLGIILSNLIRSAYDDMGQNIRNLSTPALSPVRQQFFNQLIQEVKEQDKKIDAIYSMCEDLYGLARANKAVGLEGKADNLMLSQFVLQRQQSKLKNLLGESSSVRVYESEKLLREKEKADKVWEYIAEVYEGMITELRPMLYSTEVIQTPVPNKPKQPKQEMFDYPDDYEPELVGMRSTDKAEEPAKKLDKKAQAKKEAGDKINVPKSEKAEILLRMMKSKRE